MKSAFPHVALFKRQKKKYFASYLFVASHVPLSLPDVRNVPGELRGMTYHSMRRTWRQVEPSPDAFVFTDDHAPIERFVHGMLLGAVTGGE